MVRVLPVTQGSSMPAAGCPVQARGSVGDSGEALTLEGQVYGQATVALPVGVFYHSVNNTSKMTLMEFFGCTFIAFGPPLALFIFTIARDPLKVIVFMASAFFWLVSLLLSSLWWFAVVPLRDTLAFGLVFSVIFQEIFRLIFYLLLKKAETGLKAVWREEAGGSTNTLVNNKSLIAYVSGFGFGVISGAFSLLNVLADMAGPGTIGLHGNSQNFFLASAGLTLCFILLHTFWGVIFFHGLETKTYYPTVIVVVSHMLVSCLTLMNQRSEPIYMTSLIPAYVVMAAMGVWAFIIAGGNMRGMCKSRAASYTM